MQLSNHNFFYLSFKKTILFSNISGNDLKFNLNNSAQNKISIRFKASFLQIKICHERIMAKEYIYYSSMGKGGRIG
jgi:hypothetical protein